MNATTKLLIVSITLTKLYYSLDSLVGLPFLCINWKFTFCLSDWHLPNFLSFSLLPFPVNIIYAPLQILLSTHVSSFIKFPTDVCTHPPQCPIILRNPYSSAPHRIDSREKEREEEYRRISIIHHEKLLSFLSKHWLTFFTFCNIWLISNRGDK